MRSNSLQHIESTNRASEPVELIKPIQSAANTTEFLMLTLQKALNYQPAQVQELLTNQNQYLMQACDLGIKGDYEQIQEWFKILIEYISKMIQLFRVAYAHNGALEVGLVLSSIRCGFFSQDEYVCELAIEVMERISEDFYQKPIETGLQVIKNKKKSGASITEIKIPVFRQFQDWFVRSTKPPKIASYQRYARAVVQPPAQIGDPSSILRIVCTEIIENHQHLATNVARLILNIFREPTVEPSPVNLANFPDLLAEVLADDIYLCYQAMSILLPIMREFDRGSLQKILVESNLILRLLALASERTPDPAIRLIATTFLFDLWHMEPIIVCNPRDGIAVKDTLNEVILSGILHQDKVYRLTLYGCAFSVLTHLIDLKSQEAPVLLKTIITGFVTQMQGPNRKDRVTEEFVLRNLADLFEQRPDIPVAALLEPFIEILGERLKGERAQGGTQLKPGTITTEQLFFLIRVSRHPRLTIQSALLLLELLSTIYMGKPLFATTVLRSITELVHRFYDKSKQIRNFTDSIMIAKALSTILAYKKEDLISAPVNSRPLAITAAGGHQSESRLSSLPRNIKQENKKISNEMTRKISKYNMVILVECLYSLNNNQVQQVVTDQLRVLTERYFTAFKTTSSSYEYLIRKFNLEIDFPGQELAVQSNQTPDADSNISRRGMQQRAMSVEQLGRKVRDMEQSRLENKTRMKQLQWSEAKEPRNEIALRAIEEMNEIKQQRLRKQNAERIEELKKKEKMEKLIEGATADVAMRNLILEKEAAKRKEKVKDILAGKFSTQPSTAAESVKEQQSSSTVFNPFHENILNCMQKPNIAQKIDERELKIVLNLSRNGKEGITLVNFEFEEEDRERDAMRLVVFRYQNLFKYLFCKYTQMGQLNKRKGSVETIGDRLITIVEIQKFFKDSGLDSTLITQKELTTLVKMINDCMLLRHGQSAMDYSGFVQLIIQTSIIYHRKGRAREVSQRQAQSIKCADLVLLTIQRFQEFAIKRGEPQLLYQIPQAMSSTSGIIDEKVANQIKSLNASLKPQLDKLTIQVNQSKVIKQVSTQAIPQGARLVIGPSRCDVIEILNDIFVEGLGISLLENIISTKEGVEFSILPAFSGYNGTVTEVRTSHQSVKSLSKVETEKNKEVAQKDQTVKGKGKTGAQQTPVQQQPAKGKDVKGKAQSQQMPPPQKLPPNYPIYAVDLLVKTLRNRSEIKRNTKLDLENEQILMGENWTAPIKVACFELQQIRPCSELSDMREIAQLLEDMLTSTTQGKKYQTAQERENRKKFKAPVIPKFSDPVQLTPQLSIIAKKKREESIKAKKDQEIEQKQQRDLEFMKRGLMLKEQVKQLKEVKEEKASLEVSQKMAQIELEKEKQQQLSERLKLIDQKRDRERNEQAELKSIKQKQDALQQEVKNVLGIARQKLAQVTNQVFSECRERFCHEHGELEDENQQVQANDVLALYMADQTKEAFAEAEPEIMKHFDQVLAQQNVTSRPHGAPQHRGLNLDGVINFCIRAELLPQLVQVDDVILACKLQLRDRDHINIKLPNAGSLAIHPRMQLAYPTALQLINFENRGGHFSYEEFCLILTRLFVLTSQRGTIDSYQNMDQDVNENELYQDAVSLNFHGQLRGEILKILQCQSQTLALNNLLQELNQLAGYLELFKKEGRKAPIKPMKLDIDRISFPELRKITQFISGRLQEYKLIKLPLQAASYSSNETPFQKKELHHRFSSMTPLKAPLVPHVLPTVKKQQTIGLQPTQLNTEPRKVPLKSHGLKSQAVNTRDQRVSAVNKDLPKLTSGEAVQRVQPIQILDSNSYEDNMDKPRWSSPFEEKQQKEEKKQNFDSYRDVLENSEDMFQDYNMALNSPKERIIHGNTSPSQHQHTEAIL